METDYDAIVAELLQCQYVKDDIQSRDTELHPPYCPAFYIKAVALRMRELASEKDKEVAELTHDIGRYVEIAATEATESSRLQAELAALKARSEELENIIPECAHCGGKPAVCFGAYEGSMADFACNDCCGHGCEDGSCMPIADLGHGIVALEHQLDELRAALAAKDSSAKEKDDDDRN